MIPVANSYFSGGGLFDIGLRQAGIEINQSLDIDPEATAVMQLNRHFFGHDILTEDITQNYWKRCAGAYGPMGGLAGNEIF
jgi:site-specific DNA-cytosine methylase